MDKDNYTILDHDVEITGDKSRVTVVVAHAGVFGSEPAVVGYCRITQLEAGVWWMRELHVKEASRGHGIGTALIRHAFYAANRAGVGVISLGARTDNEGAIRLYLKMGFRRSYVYDDGKNEMYTWYATEGQSS